MIKNAQRRRQAKFSEAKLTAKQSLDMLAEEIQLATKAGDFDFVDYLCRAMLEVIDRKDEIHGETDRWE